MRDLVGLRDQKERQISSISGLSLTVHEKETDSAAVLLERERRTDGVHVFLVQNKNIIN